jgi:predicted LPLAT superfamily acyltransferase
MSSASVKKRLEQLGHLFFYAVLKVGGLRCAYLFLYPVIFSYVLFSRKIHAVTSPYLKKRFPHSSGGQLFRATFSNLFAFGQVLVDRAWLGLVEKADMTGTLVGKEELFDAIAAGKGAVLVTAHVGPWQTAMAYLNLLPVKVHALMQYDQFAAAKHFFDLGKKDRHFNIINIEGSFGGMIDAAAALQRGEVVTIMADRYIKGSTKTVEFLGNEVRLPDAAYTLAACFDAPVVVFLAAKTGATHFELRVWDIFYPTFEDRSTRNEALRQCCRKYAEALEKYVKKYPYQWYNFFEIWKQAESRSSSKSLNTGTVQK